MISYLYVDNYKCLINFEVRFENINMLLGPNGVGKTSVLDVIYAIKRLVSGESKVSDPGAFPGSTLTSWQNRCVQVFEIGVLIDGVLMMYRLEIEHDTKSKKSRIIKERLEYQARSLFIFEMGEVTLYRDDYSQGPGYSADWSESALARVPARHDNTRLTRFINYMTGVSVCSLFPNTFQAESLSEDRSLSRNCSNFSSWYRHVNQEYTARLFPYFQVLGEVIDGFQSLNMKQVGLEARALFVAFEQYGNSYQLPFSELSDGQKALIVLYAILYIVNEGNSPVFIDEPENYVALPEIQPWLIHLKETCEAENRQVIVCSHHPEFVDYLGPECGIILQRERTGVTVVDRASKLEIEGGMKLSEVISRGWEQ